MGMIEVDGVICRPDDVLPGDPGFVDLLQGRNLHVCAVSHLESSLSLSKESWLDFRAS